MLKVTFLLSYFSVTKSTKSHLRGFSILLKIFFPRARVSRVKYAWRVRAARDIAKVGGFTALHNFNYTTRANISREEAEQIRARIVCTPAERVGGRESSTHADRTDSAFFICLLVVLGFYLVGVGAVDDPR